MKKLLFGIFAHPDDEAFGPAGTLYLKAQSRTEVHLILVTDGDAGENNHGSPNLRETRLKEWLKSGDLIGATSMHRLGYKDGELSNKLYVEIAEKIINYIKSIVEEYNIDIEISFLTFDQNGISGHLDHVAVSLITTYVFLKFKSLNLENVEIADLSYFCLPNDQVNDANINWLYMPNGRNALEISEIVDVSSVLDKKLAIMKAHKSQKADMDSILEARKDTSSSTSEHFYKYSSK